MQPFDSTLLVEQVRGAILKAILNKELVDKLPSEGTLATTLNVSRTTIRGALAGLEREGIITRRRAIGTTINQHVRPSSLALQRLVGFTDMLKEKGYEVHVDADRSRVEQPPSDLLAAFGDDVPADEPAFLTDTRFYADGNLAIFIRDSVPWSKLTDQSRLPEMAPATHFDFTRPYLVSPIDHAVVEVRAGVSPANSTYLETRDGQAFTRLLERHYTREGAIAAVSLIDVNNDFVVFEIIRRM
ncbi:GntR family transcriptional regulator [Embleya sp. NPDC050154]|uniref:GntR family transcriptional regulator n=1 Tax=unclassified Embleya TaxID=2699296 RepID=UPI003795230A